MRLICFILSCFCVFLSYSQENINYFDKYNNQHLETYIFDITFITADDTINKQNLYSLQADSIYLFFYDPFCEHCIGEIKKLKKNKRINKAIKENSLVVLGIAPDIDYFTWQKTQKEMPKQWLNVYSSQNAEIIKRLLWKVPELFVLDKEKKIIYINMYREDLEDE